MTVKGAREHNLKNVDVGVPAGRAGGGHRRVGRGQVVAHQRHPAAGAAPQAAGQLRPASASTAASPASSSIDKVIDIDQKPIGRTPRSNPATYTKAFDAIRDVFAQTPEARAYGYQPGRFSFNVRGGRCEACEGDGVRQVEMHFLPDVYVTCEVCRGKRYNEATLRVKWKDRSIAEVLETSVADALGLFEHHRVAARDPADAGRRRPRLHRARPVGDDAVGRRGAAHQAVARARQARHRAARCYLLDEPTTGLHFEDVRKLLAVLDRLVDAGNTVLVIEHNLDVIKTADYVIDLGPEGGARGGEIVAAGTPEEVARVAGSYTGQFLAPLLGIRRARARATTAA